MNQPPSVVIIGGGLAGLSAAAALADSPSPVRVRILEAKRVCGGRAGSFSPSKNGWDSEETTIDYCQHVAMGCCTSLLGLLQRTGLADQFTRYQELTFYHPEHGFSRFAPGRWLPAPIHLAPALFGLQYLTRTEKMRICRGILALLRSRPRDLAELTAATWLQQHEQCHRTRERFWDVILISALGAPCEAVSMQAARKVIVDGFAGAKHASDVWVPNVPLAELFGHRLPAWLVERGVIIDTSTPVQDLVVAPDGVRVRLKDGEAIAGDHVILATPWRAAAKLLGDSQLTEGDSRNFFQRVTDTLQSVRSSPITGLHLWFDQPITSLPHVAMVGTTAQWLFCDPIRQSDPSTHGYYHQVVISGPNRGSESAQTSLVEQVVDELKAAFPTAKNCRLLASQVVADPQAVFQISPQFERHRLASKTPIAGFHLAGDWVQTGWPATMEGAVRSGIQAARQVGTAMGVTIHRHWSTRDLPRGVLARYLIRS